MNTILTTLSNDGFGPVKASYNPIIYPYILGLLGVAIIYLIGDFIENTRYSNFIRNMSSGFIKFIIEILLILIVWLGFSSPLNTLPFIHPPLISSAFSGIYLFVSVLIHGICTYYGLQTLLFAWLRRLTFQAPIFFSSRLGACIIWGGIAFNFYYWEILHWSLPFVILIETLFASYFAILFLRIFLGSEDLILAQGKMQAYRFRLVLILLGTMVFWEFIFFTHPISNFYANLFGLFAIVTTIDSLLSAFFASLDRRGDLYYTFLNSQWRYIITVPVTVAIIFWGTINGFASFTTNSYLDSTVWVEAGAAIIAFMLFAPLTDEARKRSYALARDPIEIRFWDRFNERIEQIFQLEPTPLIGDGKTANNLPQAQPKQSIEERNIQEEGQYAQQNFHSLGYPAFHVILFFTVIYHMIAANVQVPHSVLLENPVQVIAGLFGIFFSIINVLKSKDSKVFTFSILMLLITIIVGISAYFITYIPVSYSTTAITSTSWQDLITNTSYIISAVKSFLIELSFLLLAGHLVYLVQIVRSGLDTDSVNTTRTPVLVDSTIQRR